MTNEIETEKEIREVQRRDMFISIALSIVIAEIKAHNDFTWLSIATLTNQLLEAAEQFAKGKEESTCGTEE